jgi:hypothetical protein
MLTYRKTGWSKTTPATFMCSLPLLHYLLKLDQRNGPSPCRNLYNENVAMRTPLDTSTIKPHVSN